MRQLFQYNHRGFHPNDRDTTELIKQWRGRLFGTDGALTGLIGRRGERAVTLADVNHVIKQYLSTDRMRVVVITKDADGLRDAIIKGTPSPIKYNSPKPDDILAEDKIIETYKIGVRPEQVAVVPVERVFQ